MQETIVEALGGPLDGEVFDCRDTAKGPITLRYKLKKCDVQMSKGLTDNYCCACENGPYEAQYIWDGKKLTYARA